MLNRKINLLVIIVLLFSCKKENNNASLPSNSLGLYFAQQTSIKYNSIIACAAGKPNGLDGTGQYPTSVFFYPVTGATDFKYFEAEDISDSLNFNKYFKKELTDSPVFNGYLWKFNNTPFIDERMGIVTYKVNDELRVCTPIRLKTNIKPTEQNNNLVTVTENDTTPTFNWNDGMINENVIYFQVISDTLGNLITGTYTYDKNFTFYNLNNVVLNVTDSASTPSLKPNSAYNFTLMAVSEDNWVNLIIQKRFNTY